MQLELAEVDNRKAGEEFPSVTAHDTVKAARSPSCKLYDASLTGIAYDCDCGLEGCIVTPDAPPNPLKYTQGPSHWPIVEFTLKNGYDKLSLAMRRCSRQLLSRFATHPFAAQ